jgi:hypothetical protein
MAVFVQTVFWVFTPHSLAGISWLRHYATSLKVAGLTPDFNGYFN